MHYLDPKPVTLLWFSFWEIVSPTNYNYTFFVIVNQLLNRLGGILSQNV